MNNPFANTETYHQRVERYTKLAEHYNAAVTRILSLLGDAQYPGYKIKTRKVFTTYDESNPGEFFIHEWLLNTGEGCSYMSRVTVSLVTARKRDTEIFYFRCLSSRNLSSEKSPEITDSNAEEELIRLIKRSLEGF